MPPESSPSPRKLTAHYRKVDVEITQEQIELATRASSSHCMIAEALQVAIPEAKLIAVDLQAIRFTDPNKRQRYTYLTPPVAQSKLVAFDQGWPLEPFKFTLRTPVQVIAAGTRKRGESRAFEGMRTTTQSKLGVKMGGEPMPMAALYTGPGNPPAYVQALRSDEFTETEHVDVAETEQTQRNDVQAPFAETDQAPFTETERTQNVTLSTRRGRVRRYGMRQLKP